MIITPNFWRKIAETIGNIRDFYGFCFASERGRKMEYLVKKLIKNEELEKRIKIICSFNKAKCNFTQGRIIDIENSNISFIEPHRVIIKVNGYKLLLLYYDADNIFLYDRSMQIDLAKIELMLSKLKKKVS